MFLRCFSSRIKPNQDIRHETSIFSKLSHLKLVAIHGNPADQYIPRNGNTLNFIAPGINAQLTPDGSHLDAIAHPDTLLNISTTIDKDGAVTLDELERSELSIQEILPLRP